MSWIADRDIEYLYKIPSGEERILTMPASEDAPTEYTFEDGIIGVLRGFLPQEVRQTSIVEYDQNGRKAVRIRDKNGTIRHISKSKLHYIKTGKIENQYTDKFKAHITKTNQEQLLATEASRRRAAVTQVDPDTILKEKIGQLPDGEYASDGKEFFQKIK